MAAAAPGDPYVMVAAIDFGTTFSGYAFSFKGSETDIKMNKNWGDTVGFLSYKTPTTVLLTGKDLKFEAFGYDAEDKYIDVEDEDDGVDKNLFRHFKMVLHKTEKLTTKTVVWSTDGQLTPAIEIFTHALRYLKEHLLEQLTQELANPPDPDMIRWVVTVPAIWSEESKNFMREAAFRSGCIKEKSSRQLLIALEPEAASFYCRQLDIAKFETGGDICFPSGTKYLVLDCGGGTNDIVVHEVVLDYKIKEVIAVTGGSYGGTRIEESFISLLKDILGDGFIDSFRKEFPDQWFLFMTKFERLKKKVKNDGASKMSIEMPYSIEGKYSTVFPGRRLKNTFTDKGIKFANGMISLPNNVIKSLFKETVDYIAQSVRGIYNDSKAKPLKYIFMVGGFSESPFLQEVMKSEFGSNGCKVLFPSEAQLAIVKGAVLFGHHHNSIVSRIARKTYGINIHIPFNHLIHDSSQNYLGTDDIMVCEYFKPLVEIGSRIEVTRSEDLTVHMRHKLKKIAIKCFSLPRQAHKPIEYVHDNPDLTFLGELVIYRPEHDTERKRYYTVKMTFSSTEILVEVIHDISGESVSTTLDFLSDT